MKKTKYIIIIVILIIALGLTAAYAILGPRGFKTTEKGKAFLDDVLTLQSNLSYYVGASYSDSFGVYTKEEILLGKTLEDGEKIKDNEDNVLPTLVNEENTIEYKGEKGYELNIEYVNTTLKIKIPTYEGVTFYVVEGDLVKVKLDSTPDWWNSNYDGLKI